MLTTVAAVWVKGPVRYTADYVVRLERMVRRHLARPFRFVCLTDQPELLPDHIETIRITAAQGVMPHSCGYWAKVELFKPGRFVAGARVLFIDLDSLVVGPLEPILDAPAPFVTTEDVFIHERAHLDKDRYGHTLIRRFQGSVYCWDGGTHTDLYTAWSPSVAFRLSTDQDWLAERHPDALALPFAWFPRISREQPPWRPDAKIVFVKKPKPHDAIQKWPWFDEAWGGWA